MSEIKPYIVHCFNLVLFSKLTLSSLSWTIFETDTPEDSTINDFVQSVQTYQNPVNETVDVVYEQPLEGNIPTAPKAQRMRLNTKLRSATLVCNFFYRVYFILYFVL